MVWCGVVWCGVVCMFVSFLCCFLFFSQFSSFSFLLSVSSSLFFPLFSLLFLFFFSLLFSPPNTMERTDQPTRRPTSRHLNVIWRRASAQQSVLSLLLSPASSLLPLPSSKKIGGNFLLQEYFWRGNYFTLQFYINSEKSPSGEIAVITVLH